MLIMKKIILTICVLSFGLSLSAQQNKKEGEVVYEETMKLNIRFEGMTEQMKERMPKERKTKQILYFNEEESSYQASKEVSEENIPGQGRGGRGMRMMMGGSSGDNMVYLNFKDNLKIEQREFMTRIFLIKEEAENGSWKLSGNQKMIMDYPCQEATKITENDTISAWFTPAIPVPAGPSSFVNLPGLVLEVNINNGKRMILAQKIDFKQIDKDLIAKPKKGKKVSKEEFQKIVEEKMKEMGAERGGQGVMRIYRH